MTNTKPLSAFQAVKYICLSLKTLYMIFGPCGAFGKFFRSNIYLKLNLNNYKQNYLYMIFQAHYLESFPIQMFALCLFLRLWISYFLQQFYRICIQNSTIKSAIKGFCAKFELHGSHIILTNFKGIYLCIYFKISYIFLK